MSRARSKLAYAARVLDDARRRSVLDAINVARIALRRLEVEVHSAGGSRGEVQRVLLALNQLDAAPR
jgi:hypothetical protein